MGVIAYQMTSVRESTQAEWKTGGPVSSRAPVGASMRCVHRETLSRSVGYEGDPPWEATLLALGPEQLPLGPELLSSSVRFEKVVAAAQRARGGACFFGGDG